MELKDLLFEKKFQLKENNIGVLFESQKELAESIVDLGEHYDNVNSLRPFLSQVLKPHSDPKSRPIPLRLKKLILKLSLNRLSDRKDVQSSFIKDFEDLFHYQHDLSSIKTLKSEDIFNELLNWSSKANYQFIVTHNPAEINWENHHRAKALVSQMIQKVKSNYEIENPTLYRFYFPNLLIVKEFWLQLRKFVFEEDESSNDFNLANSFLEEINSRGWIKVFIINEDECVFPYVYFELSMNGILSDKAFFNLFYHENDITSISAMHKKDIENWYKIKYLPIICDPSNPKNTKELLFKHIINSLLIS